MNGSAVRGAVDPDLVDPYLRLQLQITLLVPQPAG
jgi:hypothetical protein